MRGIRVGLPSITYGVWKRGRRDLRECILVEKGGTMGDAVDGGKELAAETIQAFKLGLQGEKYVPGRDNAEVLRRTENLAKLDDLRASGALSESEYLAARERIIRSEDVGEPPRNRGVFGAFGQRVG